MYSLVLFIFIFFFFLRTPRPPRSTRTDTLFPYTTLFRSPTSPMSAISKIGASPSLLMATIVPASLTPVRCWIAPLMPMATYRRSEEHTSELQSLMRISYAVFCLKNKNKRTTTNRDYTTIQQEYSDTHYTR